MTSRRKLTDAEIHECLFDAETLGDSGAAKKWGVSRAAIYQYRLRMGWDRTPPVSHEVRAEFENIQSLAEQRLVGTNSETNAKPVAARTRKGRPPGRPPKGGFDESVQRRAPSSGFSPLSAAVATAERKLAAVTRESVERASLSPVQGPVLKTWADVWNLERKEFLITGVRKIREWLPTMEPKELRQLVASIKVVGELDFYHAELEADAAAEIAATNAEHETSWAPPEEDPDYAASEGFPKH